jgi:hypothetical protein
MFVTENDSKEIALCGILLKTYDIRVQANVFSPAELFEPGGITYEILGAF